MKKSVIEKEILERELSSISDLALLYFIPGNGVERLKQIITRARLILSEQSPDTIQLACFDIFKLHRWYFNQQRKQLHKNLQLELNQHKSINGLHQYFDENRYLDNQIDNLKTLYLSEIEVLDAILETGDFHGFYEITEVNTQLSNAEYYAVISLYHASSALIDFKKAQEQADESDSEWHPPALTEAYDALLEAQIALSRAREIDYQENVELNSFANAYNKASRREKMKNLNTTRYSNKYKQRREKAIAMYRQNSYKSRLQAALELIESVQKHSELLGIPPLKPDAAMDTIYKWLSSNDKNY